MRDREVPHALRLALRVHGRLGVGVERRRALVQHGEEGVPVPVLRVPLEVPEEAAELEPLLLTQAQHIRPTCIR